MRVQRKLENPPFAPSMFFELYQKIKTSLAAVVGCVMDLHARRQGCTAYPSVSAFPGTGYEARDPITQPPESAG